MVIRMLTVDPKKRITAKAIPSHPWIGAECPNAIDTKSLQKYQATRKMKKAADKIKALNKIKAAAKAFK